MKIEASPYLLPPNLGNDDYLIADPNMLVAAYEEVCENKEGEEDEDTLPLPPICCEPKVMDKEEKSNILCGIEENISHKRHDSKKKHSKTSKHQEKLKTAIYESSTMEIFSPTSPIMDDISDGSMMVGANEEISEMHDDQNQTMVEKYEKPSLCVCDIENVAHPSHPKPYKSEKSKERYLRKLKRREEKRKAEEAKSECEKIEKRQRNSFPIPIVEECKKGVKTSKTTVKKRKSLRMVSSLKAKNHHSKKPIGKFLRSLKSSVLKKVAKNQRIHKKRADNYQFAVDPILKKAMQEMTKARPDDPIGFLGEYLRTYSLTQKSGDRRKSKRHKSASLH